MNTSTHALATPDKRKPKYRIRFSKTGTALVDRLVFSIFGFDFWKEEVWYVNEDLARIHVQKLLDNEARSHKVELFY
jgi:hypothetical protein